MRSSSRASRGKVEASGVQAIPYLFKHGTRERLFKVEVDDLAITCYTEFVRIRIRDCLDVYPSPGPAVMAILRHIIDTVVLQAKSPVAPPGPHAVVRRNLR